MISTALNLAHLREVSDGDIEFERELICAFLESASGLVHELSGPGAIRAAHTLKGSARSVGAVRVAELAADFEKRLQSGDSISIEPLLAALNEIALIPLL